MSFSSMLEKEGKVTILSNISEGRNSSQTQFSDQFLVLETLMQISSIKFCYVLTIRLFHGTISTSELIIAVFRGLLYFILYKLYCFIIFQYIK